MKSLSKFVTRNLKLLTIYFAISLFLYFTSCRDDSVSTGSPPQSQDSLLFERDSLSLWRWGNVGQMYEQFTYSPDTSIKKVKITFTGETNFDSSKGNQEIYVYGYPNLTYIKDGFTAVNQNHIINHEFNTATFLEFNISINATPENFLRFIRLRNIKIYKVN
jgi:hypothetical protein